jgi:2-polyprenyl-3-methyl-5-hydroxy-6-metoxy-1,4-benzoquinol methylase
MDDTDVSDHERRFEFGANWRRFLDMVDSARIRTAEESLRNMFAESPLRGRSFIDVGCGSGLFSLAARNLGAKVHSLDYDPQSVECARVLRERFCPGDADWSIERGSAVEEIYMRRLGQHDIVYSWGVLHHTGDMWRALELTGELVKSGGALVVSIYNDQGQRSERWKRIKRYYANSPKWRQKLIVWFAFLRIWGPQLTRDFLRGRGLSTWRNYGSDRGMSAWHDLVDWVGGYPFEVAKPEEIFEFFKKRGFELQALKTCGGGIGCNEFLFVRS